MTKDCDSDEKLAQEIRDTAEILHIHIRRARQRGISVAFSTDVHSDAWEVSDIDIWREL